MTAIDLGDFQVFDALERKFWAKLRSTFIHVLDTDPTIIDEYRTSLLDASPFERMLALHDDPLDIAVTLTGTEITPEVLRRYRASITEGPPSEPVRHDLTRRSLRFAPRMGRQDSLRRLGLVSFESVKQLMGGLGYAGDEVEPGIVLWELAGKSPRYPGLPAVVATSAPKFRTSHGEPAYDVDSIVDLYNEVIGLALSDSAPSRTIDFIKRHKQEFIRSFA